MIKVLSFLLLSEVLFNPFPGGVDYVELYNSGDEPVALADLRLASVSNGAVSKLYALSNSHVVAPHDYVVLTTNRESVMADFVVAHPEKLVEVSSMPSMPDASGTVALCLADSSVVDMLQYRESMHSHALHSKEGVALERRSFEAATQMDNNWFSAASVTADGTHRGMGTPTSKNSQSTEFLFTANGISMEPSLFSPDGDGYNDLLDIAYDLPEAGLQASVTVMDSKGRIVRHLVRNALVGTSGVITWDGLDDNGGRCLRGIYSIVFEAYGADGTHQATKMAVSLVYK